MFIRQTKRKRSKDAKTFFQYSLVQSTRINGKSRQRTILYLGADKALQDKKDRKIVLEALKAMITGSQPFEDIPAPLYRLAQKYYEKYKIKYSDADEVPPSVPPKADQEHYDNIATDHIEVAENKSFGPEHLCLQTLEKLGLADFLLKTGMNRAEINKALMSIAARAIYRSSEHKTADILQINSSLKEALDYEDPITHKQLYRISDLLYARKDKIDQYLYNHITDLFSIEDKIVIYDISNTYFETGKKGSKKATYGRSKEKRYDCPIIVFTGVINAAGFIRYSRIYEGNKTDQSTLSDMLSDMEQYSESEDKTVVMDAGIATDENIALLDSEGDKYVCVSRDRLKDYPANYEHPNEEKLWDIYNTIRQVESTFRCLKTDLNIRPIHHQNDERIEAHLYLSILAYQLVNTIRYQLTDAEITYDWTNIVRIMQTQQIQTIELPTATKTIHLRKPSKPIKEVKQIYDATGCKHTQKTIKKYVVYH